MNKEHYVWARCIQNDTCGDILVRLGFDSENTQTLAIYSLMGGIQRGTFIENVRADIFSEDAKDYLQKQIEGHLSLFSMSDHSSEPSSPSKNWFKIITRDESIAISRSELKAVTRDYLVEFSPIEKKLTITVYDEYDNSFWSNEYDEDDYYNLGLEEFVDDFEEATRQLDSATIGKLLKKGLTEEDYIL